MSTNLSVNLSSQDTTATDTTPVRFVHLEQVVPDETKVSVTAIDIQRMVAMAKAGRSASNYKQPDCQAYIDGMSLVVDFRFYSWPRQVNLPYTVSSSYGAVSSPRIIRKLVQVSETFELTDAIELDYVLTGLDSYTWETECYDRNGKVIEPKPTVTVDGTTTLRCSEPCFGVVRIVGYKMGAEHTVTGRLVKYVPTPPAGGTPDEESFKESGADSFYTYQKWLDEFFGYRDVATWNGEDIDGDAYTNTTGLKITNLNITVTAKWEGVDGEEKTESLRMEVPQCVQDLLATCDPPSGIDGGGGGTGDGNSTEDVILLIRKAENIPYNVYVSACDGKVITAVRQDKDGNSW